MHYFIEKLPHLKRIQVHIEWTNAQITPQFRFGPRYVYVCHEDQNALIDLFFPTPSPRTKITQPILNELRSDFLALDLRHCDATGNGGFTATHKHHIDNNNKQFLNMTTRVMANAQNRTATPLYEKEFMRFDCQIDSTDIWVADYRPGYAVLSINIDDPRHIEIITSPFSTRTALSAVERYLVQYINPIHPTTTTTTTLIDQDGRDNPSTWAQCGYEHLGSLCRELPFGIRNYSHPTQPYSPIVRNPATVSPVHTHDTSPFRAIRPIPSTDWQDVSEIWFCHNDDVTIAETRRDAIKLTPPTILFDSNFVILHSHSCLPLHPSFNQTLSFLNGCHRSDAQVSVDDLMSPSHCLVTQSLPPLFSGQDISGSELLQWLETTLSTQLLITPTRAGASRPPTIDLRWYQTVADNLLSMHYPSIDSNKVNVNKSTPRNDPSLRNFTMFLQHHLNPETQTPDPIPFPSSTFASTLILHPKPSKIGCGDRIDLITPLHLSLRKQSKSMEMADHTGHHTHHHHHHHQHHDHDDHRHCHHTQHHSPGPECAHPQLPLPQTPLTLLTCLLQYLLNQPLQLQSRYPDWVYFLGHYWDEIVYKLLFRHEFHHAISVPIYSSTHSTNILSKTSQNNEPYQIGEALVGVFLNHDDNPDNNEELRSLTSHPLFIDFIPSMVKPTHQSSIPLNIALILVNVLFYKVFSIKQLDIVAFYKYALHASSTHFAALFSNAVENASNQIAMDQSSKQPEHHTRNPHLAAHNEMCTIACTHHPYYCQSVTHSDPFIKPTSDGEDKDNAANKQHPYFSLPPVAKSLFPISPQYNIYHMYSIESTLTSALLYLAQTKLISNLILCDLRHSCALYLGINPSITLLQSSNTPLPYFIFGDGRRNVDSSNTTTSTPNTNSGRPLIDPNNPAEFRSPTLSFSPAVKVSYRHFIRDADDDHQHAHVDAKTTALPTSLNPTTLLRSTHLTTQQFNQLLLSVQAPLSSAPAAFLYWDRELIQMYASACALRHSELPAAYIKSLNDKNDAIAKNSTLTAIAAQTKAMLAQLSKGAGALGQSQQPPLELKSSPTHDLVKTSLQLLDVAYLYLPLAPQVD